jgi:hypothetical protein
MGLDIHAASHLRYSRPVPDHDEFDRLDREANSQGKCLNEVYFLLFPNDDDWEEHLAGMKPGVYEYTPATEQHDFRAGSYSGYNLWRDQLSQFALGVPASVVWHAPEQFAGRPFVELINFTDCDGRIGTQLAGKLAADFRTHADSAAKYAATAEDGEGFLENYHDFAHAFELAARDGALRFC